MTPGGVLTACINMHHSPARRTPASACHGQGQAPGPGARPGHARVVSRQPWTRQRAVP